MELTWNMVASLGVAWTAMFALWLLSLRLRDASIVDIWWGPGFALLALVAHATSPDPNGILTVLVCLWGLRLGVYLGWRNIGHGEDRRYGAMRRKRPDRFALWSLFAVFGLQGFLQWFVALPVLVAQASRGPGATSGFVVTGVAVFSIGLFFEAVGDWQLARFKADPQNKGRVMDRGLWRYTRHPNYFGDACAWWGIFLACLPNPGVIFTVLSPIAMTWLLLRVSGVPMLERSLSRKPDYAAYCKRTNAFLPRPPKSTGGAVSD